MSRFKYSADECLAIGGAQDAIAPIWLGSRGGAALAIDIPAMTIDVLHEPYVFGGHIVEKTGTRHRDWQLITDGNFEIGPYSYGILDGVPSLPRVLCSDHEDRFVGAAGNETRMTGDFLFAGTAHIHFGHIIVEGLARLWGLSHLKEQLPGSRCMIYETVLRDFAFDLFDLAGVDRAKIIGSPPVGRPDRLFVPSPSMRSHGWIAPQQARVWDAVGARAHERLGGSGPRRVYLSRSKVEGRRLRNEVDVETLFASKGFEIVHPQELSVLQQVKIAHDAEVLAGCVGSQMYLAAFQKRGGRNIILAPENFFLPDDVLIAHAKDHDLSVFFGSLIDRYHVEGWDIDLSELRSFLEEG